MTKTIVFDIEVAFYPEITKMAIEHSVDEKKFSWNIDANMRFISHISYKINKEKVIDLAIWKYIDYPNYVEVAESHLLKDFSRAYNACDEAVAHYGKKFDIRFINSRLAKHGMPPLKPLILIDTWRILKDNFLLVNNRLDTAIKFFGCPYGKPSLQWEIWRRVSLGDVKAHKILQHRCRYDVLSLAWIYYNKLIHHAKAGRVNKALVYDKRVVDDKAISKVLKAARCPTCASKGDFIRQGYKYAKTKTSVSVKCRKCMGWHTAPLGKKGSIGRLR